MRTLIINAVYSINNGKVVYTGNMYGQKSKDEYCQYINEFTIESQNYDEFIKECKSRFVKYFDLEDDYNIITIDNFTNINYLINQLNK